MQRGMVPAFNMWAVNLKRQTLRNLTFILPYGRQQPDEPAFGCPEGKSYRDKIKMMRSYDPVDRGADVPDPYTGGEEEFQEVYDILRSVGPLVDSLTKALINTCSVLRFDCSSNTLVFAVSIKCPGVIVLHGNQG